ncbi:unnamed protein product [Boreogadus saida]
MLVKTDVCCDAILRLNGGMRGCFKTRETLGPFKMMLSVLRRPSTTKLTHTSHACHIQVELGSDSRVKLLYEQLKYHGHPTKAPIPFFLFFLFPTRALSTYNAVLEAGVDWSFGAVHSHEEI